ncbi:rhoptry protein 5b [Cystoisospora suis]|uniref:Rhoptry protein 5b n=1 Tax=Cystoisospora suis TaxID=483139 RepID=A0A2C6KFQ1_9APIC|nr:rhoptry protein 5b [Cystoisospora suis]
MWHVRHSGSSALSNTARSNRVSVVPFFVTTMSRSWLSHSALVSMILLSPGLSTANSDPVAFERSLEPTEVPVFAPPYFGLPLSSGKVGGDEGEASGIRSASRRVRLLQRQSSGEQGAAASHFSFAEGARNIRGAEAGGDSAVPRLGFLGRIRDLWRRLRGRKRRQISYPLFKPEEEEPGSEAVAMIVQQYVTPGRVRLPASWIDRAVNTWLPEGKLLEFETVAGWFSKSQSLKLQRGRVLGEGGSSVVAEVTDPHTSERYALKALVASKQDWQRDKKQFEKEYANGKSMGFSSPREVFTLCRFIVPLMKLRLPRQPPFLSVAENLVLGNRFLLSPVVQAALKTVIRGMRSAKPTANALGLHVARMSMSLQMLRLGAILQELKIVHADINPNNILVSKEGLLYLADFGVMYKEGKRTSPVSRTLGYAPPELLRAKTRMDHLIDSWEFGGTIHELWCGYAPYETRNVTFRKLDTTGYAYERDPPFPAEDSIDFTGCLPSMPRSIKGLVRKLVRLDPQKRLHLLEVNKDPHFVQARKELLKSLADWERERARATPSRARRM